MMKKVERGSNIELLRILCMVGITLQHMMMHTGALESQDMYVRIWAQFFNIFAKIGVNCFVMITAWFYSSGKFKFYKIFELYRSVLFYSIVCGLVGFCLVPQLGSFYRIAATVFPLSFGHWWFISAFMAMMMMIPVMNVLIQKSSKMQLLYAVAVGFSLMTLIPTFTASTLFVSNWGWFCWLYITIGFVKKYETEFKIVKILEHNYTWIIMEGLIFLSTLVFTVLESYVPQVREGTNFFTGMYIFPTVLASISQFLCFKNYKMKCYRWINWGGKHTLAVYLIQSDVFVTVLLWNFIGNMHFEQTKWFPVCVIGTVAAIVLVGMLISVLLDQLQKCLWELRLMKVLNRKIRNSCDFVDKIFEEEK